MTTANQIIDQALGLLGVKAPGESVSGDEATGLLFRLNGMLDSWRTVSMFAYTTSRVTYTLPSNTATATIGPAGNFVLTTRPVRLEEGCFYTSGSLDYPIQPITMAEFNAITLKGTQYTGPAYVALDTSLPTGTLYFYPLSNASIVVTLLALTQVVDFADLTTSYTLAPGYQRAIAFSFAEEICSEYERDVTPATARIAALARRNIKRANHETPQRASPPMRSKLADFYAGYS